jgi:uncharacterized protein
MWRDEQRHPERNPRRWLPKDLVTLVGTRGKNRHAELVSGIICLTIPHEKGYFELGRKQGMGDIVMKLKEFFKDQDDIILAFLFGSAAVGRENEESDIDIAILAREQSDVKTFLELKSKLSEITSREVDLALLNDASPILKMQIIQKGVLLKAKDNSSFPRFFVMGLKEYEDLKFFRMEAEKNILAGSTHG